MKREGEISARIGEGFRFMELNSRGGSFNSQVSDMVGASWSNASKVDILIYDGNWHKVAEEPGFDIHSGKTVTVAYENTDGTERRLPG